MMPPPPPPPGNMHPSGNMTIRRAIQTTFKLPTVHWTAMKPNDTKDTIWYLMDDSKVIKDLDLASFEATFKLAHQVIEVELHVEILFDERNCFRRAGGSGVTRTTTTRTRTTK